MTGFVYLVGAGPGDPGLITIRGLECLRASDAVVYDRLANAQLLAEAKDGATLISVGKSSGHHTRPQPEINQILIDLAKADKVVTRLKGGDPYVFGRGGEEGEALLAQGIPFEVVPGVTSAVAVPAYAGIPVTHRELASSFAVITGHEDERKTDSRIAWDRLATGPDTLVFLMGLTNLPVIAAQLVAHGRAPETPVAVIRWGTLPQQKTLVGTLANIAAKVSAAEWRPPAILVVGQVVRLREKLRWFDTQPLFGLRVLVTRSREQAGSLSALLRKRGAFPVEFPVIAIAPPEDWAPLDAALSRLASNDWVVFTSVNGVKTVISRLWELGQDARAFGTARLCAIGPATAAELSRGGLRADFVPDEYIAEAILAGIGDVSGRRILLPRADLARETLAAELLARGAAVEEVVAYRTTRPPLDEAAVMRSKLSSGEIDVVTFTSSSTVRNFVSALGNPADQRLAETLHPDLEGCSAFALPPGVATAAIGPITARTAREYGLRVDIEAKEYTIPGLVEAIAEWRERRNADGPIAD